MNWCGVQGFLSRSLPRGTGFKTRREYIPVGSSKTSLFLTVLNPAPRPSDLTSSQAHRICIARSTKPQPSRDSTNYPRFFPWQGGRARTEGVYTEIHDRRSTWPTLPGKKYGVIWEVARTSRTSALNPTTTVAPFRAWRGLRRINARGPVRATIAKPWLYAI